MPSLSWRMTRHNKKRTYPQSGYVLFSCGNVAMGKGRTTGPIPAFPKEERKPHNNLKHSKKELPPLGEGMGRGFWAWGGALAFYLPALSIISLICWEK